MTGWMQAAAAGRHCLGCREGGSHKQLALHHNLWVALDGGPPAAPYGRTANYYYAAEFRVWKGRKQVKKKKRQFQRWGEQQKGRRWYTPFDVLPRRRRKRGASARPTTTTTKWCGGERETPLVLRPPHCTWFIGDCTSGVFFFSAFSLLLYISIRSGLLHTLCHRLLLHPLPSRTGLCVCVLYSSFFLLFGIFSHNAAFCLSMLDTI